jgi:5,5'-dehydrodivanillate O-demethylase
MLHPDLNERLTRVGAGTPAGDLYRRYWLPVATESDVAANPVKRVRLLGEDLVLFRTEEGELGLVTERCPHRGASLGYGFPDGPGLRCPYHGWQFSPRGECLEQPNQAPDSPQLRERSRIRGYPVRALGGLVFAYLGPDQAPALPLLDLFAAREGPGRFRDIGYAVIPCNWLQIMENSFDPTHVEWLHGRLYNYHLERAGEEPTILGGHHIKIGFDLVDYGIIKRRLREGQTEEDEEWKVGHPVYFPHILKVGGYGLS